VLLSFQTHHFQRTFMVYGECHVTAVTVQYLLLILRSSVIKFDI